MVLYFTGTGNSKYVATKIAEITNDSIFSINDAIKGNKTVEINEKIVVVAPVYAYRLPHVVSDWLLKCKIQSGIDAWFILTYASGIFNAAKYNISLCNTKNLSYKGTVGIHMPNNHITMYKVTSKDEAENIIIDTKSAIEYVGKKIASSKQLDDPKNNVIYKIGSDFLNPMFYMTIPPKKFKVTEKCIGCGACANRCPLNNIHIENGKPVWGNDCTHCLGCLSYCPKEAIEFAKKTQGKERYNIEKLKIK